MSNEKAFPKDRITGGHTGMDLRDYMAIHILPGLMVRNWSHLNLSGGDLMDVWAKNAYILADKMLIERNKKDDTPAESV